VAAIRNAAQRSSGELILVPSPASSGHYLIVKRSPNNDQARFGLALDIDAHILIETEAEFWQKPNTSITLTLPDGTALIDEQSNTYWASKTHLLFKKTLGSRTQPLLLTTQLVPQYSEILPLGRIFAGLIVLTGLLLGAILVRGLLSRIQTAELRARLGEQGVRIAHASRVNALGEMASGMAHELTQPLTAILSQSQAGIRLIGRDKTDLGAISEILTANVVQSKRATDILSRLRQWTERTDARQGYQKLNECINNVTFLLGPETRRLHINLSSKTDPADPVILGDAIEIEQLIFNLVRNAMEALEQDDKPHPHIAISSTVLKGEVILEVSDNGPGISPAMRNRLFEPFASGKQQGMGLGLVLCERIVERMGGQIELVDKRAVGATARVIIPLVTNEEKEA